MPQTDNIPMDVAPGEHILRARLIAGVKFLETIVVDEFGVPVPPSGGAVTIADGDDVAEGATTDAAASVGGTGTVSAKLRLITQQLDDLLTDISLASSTNNIGDVDVLTVGGQTPTFGAGAVAAGTQRLTLASDDPAVASLAVIDDWDESDRAKVNLISSQAGIDGGAGATTAKTVRIIAASDSPDSIKQGSLTDRSGTITTGGTAQSLAAANSSRRYLLIQNSGATGDDLWFNFTTTAVQLQPSFKLAPGASFVMEGSFISTEAISIIGPTTGQGWTAKEG